MYIHYNNILENKGYNTKTCNHNTIVRRHIVYRRTLTCCYEFYHIINLLELMTKALMYAEFHRNSASEENMVRTMYGLFKSDELRKVMNYEQQNLLYMNGFVLLIY